MCFKEMCGPNAALFFVFYTSRDRRRSSRTCTTGTTTRWCCRPSWGRSSRSTSPRGERERETLGLPRGHSGYRVFQSRRCRQSRNGLTVAPHLGCLRLTPVWSWFCFVDGRMARMPPGDDREALRLMGIIRQRSCSYTVVKASFFVVFFPFAPVLLLLLLLVGMAGEGLARAQQPHLERMAHRLNLSYTADVCRKMAHARNKSALSRRPSPLGSRRPSASRGRTAPSP